MPRAANARRPSSDGTCGQIAALLAEAMPFVARDRGEAMVRKWLGRCDIAAMSKERLVAMTADAMLLSADLLLSYPAASGTTAFDRLARSRAGAHAPESTLIAALCQSRFRLLRLEQFRPEILVRDVLTDALLRVVGAEVPPLAAGTALFGRVVILGEGCCCLPGSITPLDAAALALARNHVAAGAPGTSAGARWAEAVYGHVVQHGTMDVPGLNRPASHPESEDERLETDQGELLGLATAWAALADRSPDADLLQRTRQCTDLPTILQVLAAAVSGNDAHTEAMATGFERLLLVQLETVLHRERNGAGRLSLAAVEGAVNDAIATGWLPHAARTLLATVRRQLGGGGLRRSDDPALERVVQRIHGLRAKTVAQGCTEEEALAAAEKAAELLDRYGLSLGELEFRAQRCNGAGIETTRHRFAPIDGCVPAIAGFFDCRVCGPFNIARPWDLANAPPRPALARDRAHGGGHRCTLCLGYGQRYGTASEPRDNSHVPDVLGGFKSGHNRRSTIGLRRCERPHRHRPLTAATRVRIPQGTPMISMR